jgi:hypothetical protein
LAAKPDSEKFPRTARFEDLGLLVKFGSHITVREAQCQWVIRETFGEEVPVPEVYAWRVEGGRVFIYMQLIRGDTLMEWWEKLGGTDREVVCNLLRIGRVSVA